MHIECNRDSNWKSQKSKINIQLATRKEITAGDFLEQEDV